ncbi:hypothetical protein [Zobellia uliginosa]|uniref:hypothetical protein n=1 Tax=Zobellia uliginosa TaxID=143224 RepID=UPI001C070566|nr:hypothetical protein [Zobellia uliginosa]MBU2948047.1 hypothetical protein [Zobellia uliginosa]
MSKASEFNDWLDKEKLKIPFNELIRPNKVMFDYIKKEWEFNKINNHVIDELPFIQNFQRVKDAFDQIIQPVKPNEDRVEIASSLFQTIKQSLNRIENKEIKKLIANHFITLTEEQVNLLKVSFWAKNEHRTSFNFNKEIEGAIRDYSIVKGKVDLLLENYIYPARTHTNQNRIEKEPEAPLWFKVGVGFAKGEIQKLYKSKKSGREISKILFDKESAHPYITQTLNNNRKSKKNIYGNLNYMEKIYSYCQKQNINPCDNFMQAHSEIKKEQI